MEQDLTIQPQKKRYDWLKEYQFQAGNNANPTGRPRGKSLKTFVKDMLENMDDDHKAIYLKQLDPEFVWRMAEGNPVTNSDITSKGERIIIMPSELIEKNNKIIDVNATNTGSIDDSKGYTPLQSGELRA